MKQKFPMKCFSSTTANCYGVENSVYPNTFCRSRITVRLICNVLCLFFFLAAWAEAVEKKSVYTELTGARCSGSPTYDPETGEEVGSDTVCDGIGKYQLSLSVMDGDRNIDVITPDGKFHALNINDLFPNKQILGFGGRVEWRVAGQNEGAPIALILSVGVSTDAKSSPRNHFVVIKITGDTVCVIDAFPANLGSVDRARSLADSANNKSCRDAP
jgi:hypothetical protein